MTQFIVNNTWTDGALRDRMQSEGLPQTLTHRTNNGYILYRCSTDLLRDMVKSGLDAVLIHDVELYQTVFDRKVTHGR